MTGDDLRRFRERRGLSRKDLAELLNNALDKRYTGETVRRWEGGDRNPPKWVEAFVERTSLEEFEGVTWVDESETPFAQDQSAPDTIPAGPATPPQPPLTTGSGHYVRACEELWELIGGGVGMVGAALGNEAMMQDGAIIVNDKQALGAAWGKLAETNETFRKMLVGMTEGGAWLQVAVVTGTTLSHCWQNHAYLAEQRRQQGFVEQPVEDGREPGYDAAAA